MKIEKEMREKFDQIEEYFTTKYDKDFIIEPALDDLGFAKIFCTPKSDVFINQAIKCSFISLGKTEDAISIDIKPDDLISIGEYLKIIEPRESKTEKYIKAINKKEDGVFVEFVEDKGYCFNFNTNQRNLHYIMKSLVDCCLLAFNDTITFSHSYERGTNRDRFDIVFGVEEDFIKFCENYFSVETLK